jgi:hypothetical protein
VPQAFSFIGGRQGKRLSENGCDGSRKGFLHALERTNTVDCGCATKFMHKFEKNPQVGNSIKVWYEKLQHDACL